jgi:hypothetical protein
MAYCRFGADSDVYLYASVHGGFHCCGCRFLESPDSEVMETAKAAWSHLRKHLSAGHKVPKYALDCLKETL